MNIKEIDTSSLEEVKNLFKGAFGGPPWNEEWKDNQLDEYLHDLIDVRGSLVFGLFECNTMIGVSIGKIKHWCSGTEYFIEELCISNDYQGRGMGKEFFSLIKEQLRERQIHQIFLLTDKDKPAYGFYKRVGFKELPETTSFFMEF